MKILYVPKNVNIEPHLLELFEHIAGVRFFETHCMVFSQRLFTYSASTTRGKVPSDKCLGHSLASSLFMHKKLERPMPIATLLLLR